MKNNDLILNREDSMENSNEEPPSSLPCVKNHREFDGTVRVARRRIWTSFFIFSGLPHISHRHSSVGNFISFQL